MSSFSSVFVVQSTLSSGDLPSSYVERDFIYGMETEDTESETPLEPKSFRHLVQSQRMAIIDWMIQFAATKHLQRETVSLAIKYFDKIGTALDK